MFAEQLNRLRQWLPWATSVPAQERAETCEPQYDHFWSIGIYTGSSPLVFEPAPNAANPVLTAKDVTDVRASIVADPLMLKVRGRWYMFFELINCETRKGEIGLATSDDGFRWQYQQVVLAEPFHLSYPYVFEWNGDYYMIPESHQVKEVRLYQASRFPDKWDCVEVLLRGHSFCDSSIVRYREQWWLFTETGLHRFDTLRLFYSSSLTGPWCEHPKSPIVQRDPHSARPAGRIIAHGDRLIRYAQDCFPSYGKRVRAFEITELTRSSYVEEPVQHTILEGNGAGWNESGMHHIDPHPNDEHGWIACVDGRIEVERPRRGH
jgi:hypothetical protein